MGGKNGIVFPHDIIFQYNINYHILSIYPVYNSSLYIYIYIPPIAHAGGIINHNGTTRFLNGIIHWISFSNSLGVSSHRMPLHRDTGHDHRSDWRLTKMVRNSIAEFHDLWLILPYKNGDFPWQNHGKIGVDRFGQWWNFTDFRHLFVKRRKWQHWKGWFLLLSCHWNLRKKPKLT